ncbi:MAG: hypothetical protein BAJALOKI1v1_1670005 [Promethearchaeota archaeon]|nr:MAG: hypothetical protein BAJALOKI1v1_1670005 [Candidatus Lokiarchaeota archaeon]
MNSQALTGLAFNQITKEEFIKSKQRLEPIISNGILPHIEPYNPWKMDLNEFIPVSGKERIPFIMYHNLFTGNRSPPTMIVEFLF